MKIVIASTIVPFIDGGANLMTDWLERKLREYGHQVDVVRIPFSSYHPEMLSQITALRLYHLEDVCERLICIRMPSYVIPHPDKYLWFIHHYREVYDLWNTELDFLPKDPKTLAIREYIMRSDDATLPEAKKLYTNSKIISKRLMDFNGIASEPLYPPILNPGQFYCSGYGDYIYYTSRICLSKRQFLAVQAMKHTKTPVRLIVSGNAENPEYLEKMYQYIRANSLEKKIEIINEWITEEQKAQYLADCLVALYIPFDEDSYGYTSLEAHHSRKAVITCTDSGGTDELIADGDNGFILPPDPKALARSFDRLYEDKKEAERMGRRGCEKIMEMGITWDNVVGRFTK